MTRRSDVQASLQDGTPMPTATFGPVDGFMQDGAGRRLGFTITLVQSGPKVPVVPPEFEFVLAGFPPGPGTKTVLRMQCRQEWSA